MTAKASPRATELTSEQERIPRRGEIEAVRDLLAIVTLITGVFLVASAMLASQVGVAGPQRLATWATLGTTGLVLLAIGGGLWLSHRWTAYVLALVALGGAASATLVASGVIARSVRLALGGPLVPALIAVGSALVALGAVWLARRKDWERTGPMTGLGPVLIGLAGGAIGAALLATLMEGVGLHGLSRVVSVAFIGGAAAVFGVVLAYGAHRFATDGAKWPLAMAALVLAVPVVTTQMSPRILGGSPAWPAVINGDMISPLVEIIPRQEKGGAAVEVTADESDVMLGIEGFVTFVKATKNGQVVLDQRVSPDGLSHSLPAGEYELESYYRNCDGWCGLLDPPGSVCSVAAELNAGQAYDLTITLRDRSCVLR